MRFNQFLRSWKIQGTTQLADLFGGIITSGAQRSPIVTATYGPTVAINAALGNMFVVTVSNAVAFAIGAPTNVPASGYSQLLLITVKNASGGAHGAGTFNAVFKTSGNIPAIANGSSRTFAFRYDGTNWTEVFRTAADVAN